MSKFIVTASPTFALIIAKIVNQHFINEAIREKDRAIQEQNKLLLTQKAQLVSKNNKIDIMAHNINKLLKSNKQILKVSNTLILRNDVLNNTVIDSNKKIDSLTKTITIIAKDRVVKSERQANYPIFIIMKDVRTKNRKKKYYVIRAKFQSVASLVATYTQKHEGAIILNKIDDVPNGINMWDRIKEQLRDKIEYRYNAFGLNAPYNEINLLKDVNNINCAKYDI